MIDGRVLKMFNSWSVCNNIMHKYTIIQMPIIKLVMISLYGLPLKSDRVD